MLWLYHYPNWLVGFAIVAAIIGVALSGHRLWRRLVGFRCTAEDSGMVMGMLAVVAMMLSLLLAFSSMSVWEVYGSAESAVASEASVSGELVRDLSVYGGPSATAAREAVRNYLRTVIKDEWPAMAQGSHSEAAAHAFNAIFHRAAAIAPRNAREEILLAEIWSKINELNVFRRGRLNSADGSAVPGALWGTLLLGILFNFLMFYLLPVTRLNNWMLGLYAGTLGLMIFFIIVMDRPFAGGVSISTVPYENALKSMLRWDAEIPLRSASPVAANKYK